MFAIGVDIGGTKCAVCLGRPSENHVEIVHKCLPHATASVSPQEMVRLLAADVRTCIALSPERPVGIGISCGGPLDSRTGRILSPPNLPGWDDLPIVDELQGRTGLPAWLCNDANACALAEWRFGAGRGCSNLLFLTFGTGLGAGLILNGRLYTGACDMAGELGHIRLAQFGPVGYGKMGAVEGCSSGGGIAQLARLFVMQELQQGKKPALCPSMDQLGSITAADVGRAAQVGDPLAVSILQAAGEQLGKGLSMVIDLLSPERIVIGSIFARCREQLWPAAARVIAAETLPAARAACTVVPCALSESVGDIAALTVALYYQEKENRL